MTKPLFGKKIAILAANGFCEEDLTQSQRALLEAGAQAKIVSPEQGLVNGWAGTGWGHHFAVDAVLSTALGADYDVLVVPGGQRSLEKLKTTAHTRRFVSNFVVAEKPMILFNEAIDLLAHTESAEGRTVSGAESMRADITRAGAQWSDENPCIDQNLFSGAVGEENRQDFIRAAIAFAASYDNLDMEQAA